MNTSKHDMMVHFIDVCAYMGAVWFFLTKLITQPLLSHLNKKQKID